VGEKGPPRESDQKGEKKFTSGEEQYRNSTGTTKNPGKGSKGENLTIGGRKSLRKKSPLKRMKVILKSLAGDRKQSSPGSGTLPGKMRRKVGRGSVEAEGGSPTDRCLRKRSPKKKKGSHLVVGKVRPEKKRFYRQKI